MVSKSILLHIGTGKTGTTSIQHALGSAGEHLEPVRYPLPLFNGDRSHNRLITLYVPRERLPAVWQNVDPTSQVPYRRFLFDQLAEADEAILSAEVLSTYFTVSEVKRLRDDLEHIGFHDFHILMYVRDPAGYFMSSMQQLLKRSGVATPAECDPIAFRYPIRSMCETWEQVFPGRVVVRKFSSNSEVDVVQDFSDTVKQLFGVSLPVPPKRFNESLSAESLQIIQDYKRAFSPGNQGLLTQDAAKLVRFLESATDIPQTAPVLKRHLAEYIRAKHKADADFLNSRYGVDLALPDTQPTVDTEKTYLVGDLVESLDQKVVYQLLLRLAETELKRPEPGRKRSLPRRIASRAYGELRGLSPRSRHRHN